MKQYHSTIYGKADYSKSKRYVDVLKNDLSATIKKLLPGEKIIGNYSEK